MTQIPASTYRLQITPDFTFDRAAEVLDYLADLGVDWIYLSPVLQSEHGSGHGYDVVDHGRVDEARGGAEGFERLIAAARERGLGVLVDIVPNHMGVATPSANAAWWDLLLNGHESSYAHWFDVDWDYGDGKIRVPVLGDDRLDDLRIEWDADGTAVLTYFEHRFPVASGTAEPDADPVTVHSRQHYELVNWRRADRELNYRRFFAVNTLAAIRVEDPDVYRESHAQISRWAREGLIDGIRVDHPDGLNHPGGYLQALSETIQGRYLLVEKILEGAETLPASWPVHGTTGYDALAEFDRVLVDPAGEAPLNALQTSLAGADDLDYLGMVHGTKRAVADGILHSEVLRLARDLDRAGSVPEGVSDETVADALAELVSCMDVYRSYLPVGEAELRHAIAAARHNRPDLESTINDISPALLDPTHPAAVRFQQTSGMVMAKGVEDCAFYRYTRLTSLTEVGADPTEFALTPAQFHERQLARQSRYPASMTTLSTHDTKRSEDTRARISALVEIPDEWASAVRSLSDRVSTGDGSLDTLLWQAAVGAWPVEPERLHAYAEKAAREAGRSTSWADPDHNFERVMHAGIDALYADPEVRAIVENVVDRVRAAGWSNGLSAKLLQVMAPGVPDVYQGSELWERSLVDPDNRRPVDYVERARLLAELRDGPLPPLDESARAKLLVTAAALRTRRDRADLFTGYEPVWAEGSASDHAVAFSRGSIIAVATRLPIALETHGGWRDTTLPIPWPQCVDLITGRVHRGPSPALRDLLHRYPVALLALGGQGWGAQVQSDRAQESDQMGTIEEAQE